MADMDEETMKPADEGDPDDETQDFRFLASLSLKNAAIPKRGEKDFESHSTALQSNTLAASRQAMHHALSFQRVHQPKSHEVATYHPETNTAYLYTPKAIHFAKMGFTRPVHNDPLGHPGSFEHRLWLLPEEVLYLLERGSLDVWWPASDDDDGKEGVPMSLQGAYAMFIGDEDSRARMRRSSIPSSELTSSPVSLTLERYTVYASLKRMGYSVLRAPGWDTPTLTPGDECFAPSPRRTWQVGLTESAIWWYSLFSENADKKMEEQETGPLVHRGLYRSYSDIYRRLAIINNYDPTSQKVPSEPTIPYPDLESDLRTSYHAWKPGSPTFKKSAPGPPDFRIVVINARETTIPTLEQLGGVLETTPYDPPIPTAQLYAKLKHGYKNVILAVVDQGVVSYIRVSDAAFGREKLHEREGSGPRGKRGGRGSPGRGGRGRGR